MCELSIKDKINGLAISSDITSGKFWKGSSDSVAYDDKGIKEKLRLTDRFCYIVINNNGLIGAVSQGNLSEVSDNGGMQVLAVIPPMPPQILGDEGFLNEYGVKYPYMAGSMAHGISSLEMAKALGREKILCSLGTGGMMPGEIEDSIVRLKQEEIPCAFNLLFSPQYKGLEKQTIELYLKHNVNIIEASAYMDITPHLVYYRAAGLSLDPSGKLNIKNRIIAKVSRRETASKFLMHPPGDVLNYLVSQGCITEVQAKLSEKIPLVDDLTAEAGSGGHTDNRPLNCILPSIIQLRDGIQEKQGYLKQARIGAGGGIGTPDSALAAFIMGASYIVTGSINQSCVEAGTSEYIKNMLSNVSYTDVMMAPSTDMFELGAKVQLLKKGTLFPLRARKLYETYRTYNSIDEIPKPDRKKLEQQIFKKSIDEVWNETVDFFNARDKEQLKLAKNDPKKKMALIFRWYLGQSTKWSIRGVKGRETDYQVWCGPSIGSFNDWVANSYLAVSVNRKVADVAKHIMSGAAYMMRIHYLKLSGVKIPTHYSQYIPMSLYN